MVAEEPVHPSEDRPAVARPSGDSAFAHPEDRGAVLPLGERQEARPSEDPEPDRELPAEALRVLRGEDRRRDGDAWLGAA